MLTSLGQFIEEITVMRYLGIGELIRTKHLVETSFMHSTLLKGIVFLSSLQTFQLSLL